MTRTWLLLGTIFALTTSGAAARADEVRTVDTAIRAHAAPSALEGVAARVEASLPFAGNLPSRLVRYLGDEGTLLGAERKKLRIAVVPIEFDDQKRDPRFAAADWERMLFSRRAYTKTSPSGEPVFGSVADYYDENSCGRMQLEGHVFDWVHASRSKAFYDRIPIVGAALFLYRGALGSLEAREGKSVLDGYDCVCFVVAGERGAHPHMMWPHASAQLWHGKLLQYYVVSETEGKRFTTIGVHCHELGHIHGILDMYGSGPQDGVGIWDNMAIGDMGDPQNRDRRPLHFSAWSKMKLGWLSPVSVDPAVRQTIRLKPVEGSTKEAVKVLTTPDGSEYFLLENRAARGFDAGIPSRGLLIWRVGELGASLKNGVWPYRIDLEEAHGQKRGGTHKDLEHTAWPQAGKSEFTPFSWPDSNSWSLSARDVFITDIKRDGEDIVFTIGK